MYVEQIFKFDFIKSVVPYEQILFYIFDLFFRKEFSTC